MTAIELIMTLPLEQKQLLLAIIDAEALLDDCKLRTFTDLYLHGIKGTITLTEQEATEQLTDIISNDETIALHLIGKL